MRKQILITQPQKGLIIIDLDSQPGIYYGRRDQGLAGIGILETNATQIVWISLRAPVRVERDGLVADDSSEAIDGRGIQPSRVHVALGAGYEEGTSGMQGLQSLEIDMSKSRPETFVGPWDVLEKYGADAFRWYMYTSGSPGEPRRFSVELVGDVVRSFYLTLWNCFSFFTTYAELDNFDPKTKPVPLGQREELDCWILGELNLLVDRVTQAYENYDAPNASKPVEDFVDTSVTGIYAVPVVASGNPLTTTTSWPPTRHCTPVWSPWLNCWPQRCHFLASGCIGNWSLMWIRQRQKAYTWDAGRKLMQD